MKGHWIVYSNAEMRWLEANRLMVISDYHRAFCAEFGRLGVSAVNLHSLRKRKGWRTGRTGQFEKGAISHNKGKKCAPGTGGLHPNACKTQFKKGCRSGIAVDLYKPIGAERVSKEGYGEIKIHDGMPMQSRWRGIHLVEWEKLNGPVPKDHVLKCLDGDRQNTDPSNWELVPRALLPRLNGRFGRNYDSAPAEVKPTIMAIARLEHRARTKAADRRP